MFAFAFETDGVLSLVCSPVGHVYTWPDKKTALEFFEVAKCEAHLYQFTMDLQMGHLVERGDTDLEGPDEVYPDDEQKTALFKSYVYPSLLEWTPLEQTIEVPA